MNANIVSTTLLSVSVALAGWNLTATVGQGKELAALRVQTEAGNASDVEIKARLVAAEANVAALQLQVALIKARLPANASVGH